MLGIRPLDRRFVSAAFWCVTATLGLVFAASAPLFLRIFVVTEPAAACARTFLDRAGAGDVPGAYALLATSFRERLDPDSFRVLVEKNPGTFQVSDATFPSRHVLEGRIQLRGTLATRRGETKNCLFELVPEGAGGTEWRVSHFQIADDPIPR